MRIHLVLPLLLATGLVAACSSLQPDPGAPGRAGTAAGACQADPVAWAVGQPANEEVMRRVWRESGAGLVRPIGPGQAVTRDFRRDRLNVHIDRSNIITAVDCG
ncbi:I78 family peptidase inhibitor [Pseudoxanthomonas sp. J35]|uniref:I78 family peptidase inhibitor n=1 Tax=Pseudoxanthomonas sp. J35 TaxID=935852 RepID=UPI00048E997D|nr:I78 family peptidase inhibitor [Pseudoxanthomonas sp. J35]